MDGVCSEGKVQKTYLTLSFAKQIRHPVHETELRILFIDMTVGEKMRFQD